MCTCVQRETERVVRKTVFVVVLPSVDVLDVVVALSMVSLLLFGCSTNQFVVGFSCAVVVLIVVAVVVVVVVVFGWLCYCYC